MGKDQGEGKSWKRLLKSPRRYGSGILLFSVLRNRKVKKVQMPRDLAVIGT